MARTNRRTILMWVLYALFFLVVLLLQDAVFSKYSFWGVRIVLAPLATACVAAHTGTEKGGLFCLLCGLFWALTGASDGGITLFFMTFAGVLCGYLCSAFFHPRVLPVAVLSLLSLAMCLVPASLVRIYLEGLNLRSLAPVGLQVLLAVPAAPLLHWCSKAIRKVGQ